MPPSKRAVFVRFSFTATIRVFCNKPERLVMLARSFAFAIAFVMLGIAVTVITVAIVATIITSFRVNPD